MDYADPDGPTISVALARVPADPDAERIGTLVVNPGGPGVPGLFLAPVLKSIADLDPDEAAVLDRFDIVSFDHRGSGKTTAVDCGDTTDLDLVDYSPDPRRRWPSSPRPWRRSPPRVTSTPARCSHT